MVNTTTMIKQTAARLATVCQRANQTAWRLKVASTGPSYGHFNSLEPTVALATGKKHPLVAHERELRWRTEYTVDRVRGEHTTHELFLFVGYLYLCNNSAVKCVPCTVPHFIVHKDTKKISPKTTSMSCWYRYVTHLTYFIDWPFCSATH